MQRHLRFIIPILIIGVAISFAATRTNQTIATRHTMPKPPSYPFDEARKIAEANLPKFMQSIGMNYATYGFKSVDGLSRATLGIPYVGYSFDLLNVPESASLKGDIRDYLDGGVQITFPVLVDNEMHASMEVEFRDGKWQDGPWSSYTPKMIVGLQERLVAKGITERLDQVNFGFVQTIFGMIDYNGQTMLIPLQDAGNYFPELDFSSDRMYTLDEVLPLVRVQAQHMVEEIDRQNQEMMLHMPTQGPTLTPAPTATPMLVYPAPIMPPSATPDILHPTLTPIPTEIPVPAYPAP